MNSRMPFWRSSTPAGVCGANRGARGAEARHMPVGERAALGARGQIGLEPQLLGRAGGRGDAGVQDHDVPGAEIVAVVALAALAGSAAEVVEVGGGARDPVFQVVVGGMRARFVAAPRGVVAVGEIR